MTDTAKRQKVLADVHYFQLGRIVYKHITCHKLNAYEATQIISVA
jgi:hypothetical protein